MALCSVHYLPMVLSPIMFDRQNLYGIICEMWDEISIIDDSEIREYGPRNGQTVGRFVHDFGGSPVQKTRSTVKVSEMFTPNTNLQLD